METQHPKTRGLFHIIFVSPDEPRLRAGWRLLIQTALLIFLAIAASILASGLILTTGGLAGAMLNQLVELIVFGGSIFLARWLLDRRSVVSLGLRFNLQALLDLGAGIVITFFLMGSIYLAILSLGWLTFEGFAWQVDSQASVLQNTLGIFAVFLLVGWNEELLSRGYHLQTIASGTNLTWGVLLSSSVFGLLHLGNPGATWASVAGIFFAGIFLALGYLRSGQLWISIGLHIGWNFFEGVVFGFPVSGIDVYPLTRITVHGPELWTGGAFGPEAGLIVLPALVLGAALVMFYTRGRSGRPDIS